MSSFYLQKKLPPHNCRRTTADAQHALDSNDTKDFLKTLFYLFFLKNVSKDIIILFYSFSN